MADIASTLLKHHHEDYDQCKKEILEALGDLSPDDIFGRKVMVAVYVRPEVNPKTGWVSTMATLKEDWWQGKAVMIVKMGPDAFNGDAGYLKAMFGDKPPPAVGDWLIMNAASGFQFTARGDGGRRPRGKDRRGEMVDLYDWDGWPCRLLNDDEFVMRVGKPHTVV